METARAKRVSTGEALKRLAQKDVAPAYRSPRGNQKADNRAVEHERRKAESILA
jgi:hypothetical protein